MIRPGQLDALGLQDVALPPLPFCGTSVAKPIPRTTVFLRVTSIGAFRSYTPGVRIRFLPSRSSRLIRPTEVDGVAMKNLLIGSVVPALASHEAPEVFVCGDGTNTP